MKKKKKSTIIITILIIALIASCVGMFLFYSKSTDLQQKADQATSQLNQNTQTVYVATRPILKGETLSADGDNPNVQIQLIYTGLEATSYMTDDQLGSTLTVDLDTGEPVMSNMITTETLANDTRWYEVNSAEIMTTQADGDCVDVRIAFPDGTDFIVLPKKYISDLQKANCIFNTKLNEEEIIRFRSAIIDAYTIAGCKIYTTKYVESNLQEDAIPTYPVKEANIDLINSDPNILTKAEHTLNLDARLSLESRVADLDEENLQNLDAQYDEKKSGKESIWQDESANAQSQQQDTAIDYGGDSTTDDDDTQN